MRYPFKTLMLLKTFAECLFRLHFNVKRQLSALRLLGEEKKMRLLMVLTSYFGCLFIYAYNYAKHIKHATSCSPVRITLR